MIWRKNFVSLLAILVFSIIDGISIAYVLRGNKPSIASEQFVKNDFELVQDDQLQKTHSKRNARSFYDTSRNLGIDELIEKDRTDRRDNIFERFNEDSLTNDKWRRENKDFKHVIMPLERNIHISTLPPVPMQIPTSIPTSSPLPSSAPTITPTPTSVPTLVPTITSAPTSSPTLTPRPTTSQIPTSTASNIGGTGEPNNNDEYEMQNKTAAPSFYQTNLLRNPLLDQKPITSSNDSDLLSSGRPTLAPVRLPTRQRVYINPPARDGFDDTSDVKSDASDPCDDKDDREDNYNTFNNNTDHNDQSNPEKEENNGDGVPITPDDKEKEVDVGQGKNNNEISGNDEIEVGSDKGTIENEELIEDPVEADGMNSVGSGEGSTETWKYYMIGAVLSCILFVALAAFWWSRPPKHKAYKFESGRDGRFSFEVIDSTMPLDNTGGYSNDGYSRVNSIKSFETFEEIKSPSPEPTLNLFELEDPSTPSTPSTPSMPMYKHSPTHSFGALSMYESEETYESEEIRQSEIIDIDNDIENYAYSDVEEVAEIEIEDDTDDDEDIYVHSGDDSGTDEIDDLDMEESTISWDDEEILPTIEEESGSHYYEDW